MNSHWISGPGRIQLQL